MTTENVFLFANKPLNLQKTVSMTLNLFTFTKFREFIKNLSVSLNVPQFKQEGVFDKMCPPFVEDLAHKRL